MLLGVGIDIVDIDRINRVYSKWGQRFTDKIFTADEMALCRKKGNFIQSLAARFAAKEAFAKALGTGWSKDFRWREVEILSDEKGKPEIILHGNTKKALAERRTLVSLSHSDTDAIAIVIIE